MKTMLVSAFIALFAFPAVAGEMPEATPVPTANSSSVTTATTTSEAAATVATGELGKSGKLSQSVPSYSGYGGGCDRGHSSTEAMLIN
jgi:hypothetical protein